MGYHIDAAKEHFELVTVFDKPMLFTCLRVNRSTVPKGLFVYEVRHDDDGMGDPCEIADSILVNHWGTLISSQPLALEPHPISQKRSLLVDSETDWNYEGVALSLKEYMDGYAPRTARTCDRER